MHKLVIGEFVDVMANLLQGFLYAFVVVAVMLFVIALINNRKTLNALSFLISAVAVILIATQISCIIGAYDITSKTSAITDVIGMVSSTAGKIAAAYTRQDIEPYVTKKVIWCVVILVISGVGVYFTMENSLGRVGKSARYERVVSRRSERRMSRRR